MRGPSSAKRPTRNPESKPSFRPNPRCITMKSSSISLQHTPTEPIRPSVGQPTSGVNAVANGLCSGLWFFGPMCMNSLCGSRELTADMFCFPIALQTCKHQPGTNAHILNVIDSPGHVDFCSEVTYNLKAIPLVAWPSRTTVA